MNTFWNLGSGGPGRNAHAKNSHYVFVSYKIQSIPGGVHCTGALLYASKVNLAGHALTFLSGHFLSGGLLYLSLSPRQTQATATCSE